MRFLFTKNNNCPSEGQLRGGIEIERRLKPSFVIVCIGLCAAIFVVVILVSLCFNGVFDNNNTPIEASSTATIAISTTEEESTFTSVAVTEPDETSKPETKETNKSLKSKSESSKNENKSNNKSSSSNSENSNINNSSNGNHSGYYQSNNSSNNYLNKNNSRYSSNSKIEPKESSRTNNQKSSQKTTQKPTQKPTQKATQKPTQKPTKKATQKPTQAPKPQNNIYLSYRSITVKKNDVVFLTLINADAGITWSVGNSSVLQNYGGGGNQCSFKALSKGQTIVTATYNGRTYTCSVTII